MIIQTQSFELALYTSGSPDSEKLALVLPGKLDTKDYAHMRSHTDFLGARGYYAVTFDPPGTWESPGDNKLYTISNYIKATHELIAYFGNRPTALIGHSRGGTVAMLVAGGNPYVSHVAAIMSPSGPSRVQILEPSKVPQPSYRDLPPGIQRTTEQREFPLSTEYFEDQLQYNTASVMPTCKVPKLLFYGTEDALVKPASVKALYENAAQPKSLKMLKSEHDYRLHPEIVAEINACLEQFLQ